MSIQWICANGGGGGWLDYLCFLFADPVQDKENPDHYLHFPQIYSKPTTEKDRPSLRQGKGKLTTKEAGFRISGETVRARIVCDECSKPR